MATASPTASFHVLGASVQPSNEGKRLLLRTREGSAAVFVFPLSVAVGIGAALLGKEPAPDRNAGLKSRGRSGRPLDPEVRADYQAIATLQRSRPVRGTIAAECRKRGIKPENFWGWFSTQKPKKAAAISP